MKWLGYFHSSPPLTLLFISHPHPHPRRKQNTTKLENTSVCPVTLFNFLTLSFKSLQDDLTALGKGRIIHFRAYQLRSYSNGPASFCIGPPSKETILTGASICIPVASLPVTDSGSSGSDNMLNFCFGRRGEWKRGHRDCFPISSPS